MALSNRLVLAFLCIRIINETAAFDSRFQQLPASATFSSVVLTSFITSSATSFFD
jgi:hypothetical protein